MGDALEEYLTGQTVIRKYTQIFFEWTAPNILLDDTIDYVFNQKEDSSYSQILDNLSEPKTINDFKVTIIEKHFAWAIDHCKNESVDFLQPKYRKGTIVEILDAYRDVYQFLIEAIPPELDKNPILNKEIKEDIEDHLLGLIKEV